MSDDNYEFSAYSALFNAVNNSIFIRDGVANQVFWIYESHNENNLNIVENSVEDLQGEKDPLDGVYGKTSLTLEDLDKIDEYRFPKSYKYIKYDWTD